MVPRGRLSESMLDALHRSRQLAQQVTFFIPALSYSSPSGICLHCSVSLPPRRNPEISLAWYLVLLQQRSLEGIARTIRFGVDNDQDIPDDFVGNDWRDWNHDPMINLIDRRQPQPTKLSETRIFSWEMHEARMWMRSGLEFWMITVRVR